MKNDISLAALPILMAEEIYGLGFPLCCDMLKQIGITDFVKPDIHVKSIVYGCGLVKKYDDYEIFKAVVRMARLCDEKPVIVDFVLWSIGFERQRTNFIEQMKQGRLEVKGKLEVN